ncbi:MAG: DNA translocase FtsK [Candidatus Marinimicrobia bacterium]|jgi:S-DNA-T family DNA segregation ATPase FtsK/SpoIIIE|nr:DNA translocase FtsK [Candidatus Neomarinimicrobiota bacterium]
MSIITNYIVQKILSESKISEQEGTSGKFILKNYPIETFQSLLDYFTTHQEDNILLIIDDRLDVKINTHNIIKANHEVMAQYRNENIQHSNINLSAISYIIFITNEVIDTLNDISTLSPDDIRSEFTTVVGTIENTLLNIQSKLKLQNVCKVFLKDLDGISPFEMENFVDSTLILMDTEGYILEDAMGMSLYTLNAFKCRKLFESLKKSGLIKDIKKIVKPFKSITAALGKRVGNKSVAKEELNEKFKNNKDEFLLLSNEKQELINKFIFSDERERLANKQEFSALDWYDDHIYRLFEKTKSDTSKKLGKETIDLIEERDEEIDIQEKESLLQYDSLPPKERESLKHILEPVYKKYKGHIESVKSLRSKWDKFLYPSQSKSNDFILGVLETIKKLKADVDNIDHIVVSLKQSQTTAIIRNYSKYAINYLNKRYSVLNRISKTIHFEFQFIQDIEDKLEGIISPSPVIKKYKKGSQSKVANELHFIIQAQDINNEKLAERKLIWSFNSNSIMSGYREDIESIEKHISSNCLYANIVYRTSGSEKGEKKPLSLFDYSTLESRGSNSGYRLFPKTCDHPISSKNILRSAKQILDTDTFTKFSQLFSSYTQEYLWLLQQLDIKENLSKAEFDFCRVEELSNKYVELSTLLFDSSDNDKFKSEVIEPFLSLTTVRVGEENSVIIPSFHPLRLISYFVKLKHTFNFLDTYVETNTVNMIKEDLYFSDLEQSFSTPYYPEVFRLFDIDRDEESLLHISEICDDYTILEPIQNYLDSGQSTDPSAQTTILTKVIENYLALNKHKQSSLKVLLHAVNNYDFPVKFMKKLMTLEFIAKENNFEIYLNDVDASHIRKMYRSFLVNQDSKDAEEALEYNEVSFLSNIRLNAFDQSFKQLENVNDQINIAFLNDFVSSKAKLEFRKQLLDKPHSLFDYHPTMWSKRKYMTEKESSVGKYLVSPAKNDLTSSFYNLLYLTMSTHVDDYKDKIPTLNVDRSHKDLHTDLEAIHKRTDWVINLDSLLDKKILEEFGANVIKYRKARHINRNLVISSKANTVLLEHHLIKKFTDFNVRESVVQDSVKHIIKSANELSGDILLKAIGQGSFANEMLGLVLTKTILEGLSTHDNILIYIDDYADWFLSSVNSEEKLLMTQNNVLADILFITPIFMDRKLTTVYIDIVESKFCNESNRAGHAKKSLQQTKDSYAQIKKVFDNDDYFDKKYWLAKISDLIVETHHKSFTGGLTSEDIRNLIRLDKNINFVVRGMSYVFVHDHEDDSQSQTGIEGVEQYIVGSKSIVSMIESLPKFELESSELKFPNFGNIIQNKPIIQKPITILDSVSVVVPISTPEIITTDIDEKEKKEIEQKEAEKVETEGVSQAVKSIVMHHNYRAKILNVLFTPNAVSVSLKPELGWKKNDFYKMANDFLAVERLKLLRVEVVPGAYNLVFERQDRQIILYQDCLPARELTSGSGNTKILLGRKEKDNEVIYYNLDSEDPHALVAGMTKSGKSVLLNIFIIDLIRTNTVDELKLILIDPKQVEFTRYKNIPYLDSDGIIINKELAIEKLDDVVNEMEKRYSLFQKASVNELSKYNKKTDSTLSRIILIFDEFADWMLDDEFKKSASEAMQRLAGKARAAGIHLVISTQRPDNTVLPMILRGNLGAKFALRVDTEKNSNIIIDEPGAEKLLGYGHMIVKFAGEKQYVQSAYMSDEYIDEVLESL